MFRSALPRGERSQAHDISRGFIPVSIRAPARGAIFPAGIAAMFVEVSIRAPARGAIHQFNHFSSTGSFRSALPRGERSEIKGLRVQWIRFRSALPRGERCRSGGTPSRRSSFDPRSRAGSDHRAAAARVRLVGFDPRSRAGSDGSRTAWRRCICRFDPRSRAGSDPLAQHPAGGRQDVSIRAPARGAITAIAGGAPVETFRSALPRGERCQMFRMCAQGELFRSALPRGERWGGRPSNRQQGGFDPRSRAGSDNRRSGWRQRSSRFDPRSRAGSDADVRRHTPS